MYDDEMEDSGILPPPVEGTKSDVMLKDKDVLIVDDVYTTGNTAREISKSFKKNRCKNIYFVALAQTLD